MRERGQESGQPPPHDQGVSCGKPAAAGTHQVATMVTTMTAVSAPRPRSATSLERKGRCGAAVSGELNLLLLLLLLLLPRAEQRPLEESRQTPEIE